MDGTWLDSALSRRKWKRVRNSPSGGGADGAPRYVALSDTVIRVKMSGRGEHTIIITPDPPNVIEHYDGLFRAFADVARIVCFEMPGFGYSVAGPGYRFGIHDVGRVTVELIESLKINSCILAFPCVAGLAAVSVARSRPELVSSIVSVQTGSWEQQLRWAAR